jgi:hypothetical protein
MTGATVVTTVCLLPFAHGLRVLRAPGFPRALYLLRGTTFDPNLGRIAPRDHGRLPVWGGPTWRQRRDRTAVKLGGRWLPLRHDCCVDATVLQDLTVNTASSCLRRFLATPLHEIILRR